MVLNWVPDSTINTDIAQNTTNISTNATDILSLQTSLANFVINDCGDVDTTTTAPTTDDTLNMGWFKMDS